MKPRLFSMRYIARPTVVGVVVLATAMPIYAQDLETAKVVAQRVDRTVRLPGEFAAYQRVSIYARVASFVESVHVDRGSAVKRGQPLVTLAAPELAAQVAEIEAKAQAVLLQLAEADAKLISARTTAEMLKAASQTVGAVSNSELILSEQALQAAQAVKTAVENSAKAARAAADAVKELANYLEVKAPFDGVVTERFVHPGALVGPATAGVSAPLVQLEQNTRLRLVVAVPEAHVAGIMKGAAVSFTVPAYPGATFEGTIARPAQALDTRTRSMLVELDVPNPTGRLATGMYADVVWPIRRPTTSLLVPTTAVVTTTERAFVIRARGGKAEWVDVRRGSTVGDMVEVFGNLQEGDDVIRRGNDEIRNGASLTRSVPRNDGS
jgi:RND family efflux transporter MFP subunit